MLRDLLDVPVQDDNLLVWGRARALALLTLVLALVFGLSALMTLFTGDISNSSLGAAVASALFLVTYAINRRGWLATAVGVFLGGFSLLIVLVSILARSPLPSIFFMGLIVVFAAAFGRPRAALIWAGALTLVPLIINLAVYGSLLAPTERLASPDGGSASSIFALELIVVCITWMLAGAAALATRLLYQALGLSGSATQAALKAQQELAAQQADLAARNEQLSQTRAELEALVSELTVPVVPVADGIGLLPLVGSLDAGRASRIEQDALKIVAEQRMQALVIDLSGASGLRAANIQGLVRLCAALRLLGVTPVLAGLGAQSALLLSNAEVALPRTVATVQDALALLQNSTEQRVA
jgi:anti-anti-sigma regulatory factor